jgi:serine/threonine protein kinase
MAFRLVSDDTTDCLMTELQQIKFIPGPEDCGGYCQNFNSAPNITSQLTLGIARLYSKIDSATHNHQGHDKYFWRQKSADRSGVFLGSADLQDLRFLPILHGKYSLRSFIGSGRFSQVFIATDVLSSSQEVSREAVRCDTSLARVRFGDDRHRRRNTIVKSECAVAIKVLNANYALLGQREVLMLKHLAHRTRHSSGKGAILQIEVR